MREIWGCRTVSQILVSCSPGTASPFSATVYEENVIWCLHGLKSIPTLRVVIDTQPDAAFYGCHVIGFYDLVKVLLFLRKDFYCPLPWAE